MTVKEREYLMCALSNIKGTISELEYYKKSDWLHDESALNLAKSAEQFLNKIFSKSKKK